MLKLNFFWIQKSDAMYCSDEFRQLQEKIDIKPAQLMP